MSLDNGIAQPFLLNILKEELDKLKERVKLLEDSLREHGMLKGDKENGSR